MVSEIVNEGVAQFQSLPDQGKIFACGGAFILLIVLAALFIGLLRKLFGKKKPPLTPDEQYETTLLQTLQSQVAAKRRELDTKQSEVNTLAARHQCLRQDIVTLENAKQQAQTDTTAAIQEARRQLEEATTVCTTCSTRTVGSFCGKCDKPIKKPGVIPFVKTPWEEVTKYLHSIGEWGDPVEFSGPDYAYVPWPEQDETTFTVGGIVYEWGKMDDEEEDGWWAYLKYDHPIVGDVTVINKVNTDNDHLFRRDGYDDEDLNGGDISGLPRSDWKKALQQGMTALYLWMQSERVS